MTKKEQRDDWICGYACACAIVAKLEGSSQAQSLMREGGFNRQSFVDAHIEECDLEAIFPEPDEEA